MTRSAPMAAARGLRGGRITLILGSLLAGLLLGALAQGWDEALRGPAMTVAGTVGGLWLDGLKMVVVPLVVALLVVGIARGAQAAQTGQVAARSVAWFASLYAISAVVGILTMPVLLRLFPLPDAAAEALRAGLATIDSASIAASVPEAADFFRSIVPANVVQAAADGAMLPLVFFTLLFAVAITRLPAERQGTLVAFFESVADALLIIIGWVLWVAPLGILGLAFVLGAGAGGAAAGAVLHYVLLVSAVGGVMMLGGYAIAVLAARIPPLAFVRAMAGPQAVALSTQSSLASLPAMLGAARLLAIRERVADVTLPMAVALFRGTGPAMNVAVAFYVGHWLGLEPSLAQLATATAVAAVMTASAPSLPGQISFLTSNAPIAMAMGIPIEPLAILVAVETFPDLMRTVGNVTLNVAVTGAVDRQTGDPQD